MDGWMWLREADFRGPGNTARRRHLKRRVGRVVGAWEPGEKACQCQICPDISAGRDQRSLPASVSLLFNLSIPQHLMYNIDCNLTQMEANMPRVITAEISHAVPLRQLLSALPMS